MKHYCIGHQKPDVDATVSALAMAEYLRQKGYPEATAVVADPINPETEFVFKKFNQTPPPVISATDITPEDTLTLLDHNEEDQRLPGINPDQIIGIVDHHKANLNLNHPITITIKPIGSTSTIVYSKFISHQLTISANLAKLLLCAVLSDTVGLKSPTTTDKDRACVEDLQKKSGITDIAGLTLEIFKAKSNISTLTPEQIVKNDYKVFDFAQKTFIGQLETVEQTAVLDRKAELLAAMQQVKQAEGVDLLFLTLTDILQVNSKLLILGAAEQEVAQKAFGGTVVDNVLDIGPKLSRKKEIAPPIEQALHG